MTVKVIFRVSTNQHAHIAHAHARAHAHTRIHTHTEWFSVYINTVHVVRELLLSLGGNYCQDCSLDL